MKLVLPVAATAAALALAGCGSTHAASTTPAETTTSSTAASQVRASTLSAPDQAFATAVRHALTRAGTNNTSVSDAQIAHLGEQVCKAREAGASQASIISATEGKTDGRFSMTSRQFTLAAERAICPSEVQKAQTVTYVVTGTPGADVTYGPSGTDLAGSVPMRVTAKLGSPEYYAINAQLQGGGAVSCKILVNGNVLSHSVATGGYNIADCEIVKNVLSGAWESAAG